MKTRTNLKRGPVFASLLGASILMAAYSSSASAQANSGAEGLLTDTWNVSLGAFAYGANVKARLNGSSTSNPEVDFDETFGKANDSTRVRADALWRITPAHHLRFMYFDNATSRTKTLVEDVKWGDYTFLKNSSATFQDEISVISLAYEYALMRGKTYEINASAGIHYMDFSLQLSGTANITGPECTTTTCSGTKTSKTSSLPAPLPMLGLRGGWMLSPDWYLDLQGQVFKVKVDGYDGRWTDARIGATWMFHRNFGVGLGYNYFSTTVDVDRPQFDGKLRLGYSGVQAYLTGTF